MTIEQYFYNCSKEYVESISADLSSEVLDTISVLPTRQNQSEINNDLFWLLVSKGWAYSSMPQRHTKAPPSELDLDESIDSSQYKQKELCLSSTTIDTAWTCDFAKRFTGGTVQIEVQFGTVESMFKDFCGFKMAHYERRLSLGIEIILTNPNDYFQDRILEAKKEQRQSPVSGMAYFEIAKKALSVIGFQCPIWIVGFNK